MNRLPRIPRDRAADHGRAATERRRTLCETVADRPLPHLGGDPVPTTSAEGNVENLIGYAQVPVGIAGPLLVDTSDGERDIYVPMATTEGAMVASYSRGMSVLRASGGAWARVVSEGLSQHPILVYGTAAEALEAARSVKEARTDLVKITRGITSHGRLDSVEPQVIGRRLTLRMVFRTADAVGINMAAHAAELCSAEIARRTGARARYVHGQDVEKRSNTRALVEGRGRSVIAEARVPRAVLAERLRVTPEELSDISRSYATGYAQLGTANWLVQAANGLAAVLLACGQDVAYVTECANGFLDLEVVDGDLHAAVTLPSLLVGTVGGGTGHGTAAECLDILGCRGAGHANEFAEILAATVLAGDLSLMAAFCTHEFVPAHEKLGRNRPDTGA